MTSSTILHHQQYYIINNVTSSTILHHQQCCIINNVTSSTMLHHQQCYIINNVVSSTMLHHQQYYIINNVVSSTICLLHNNKFLKIPKITMKYTVLSDCASNQRCFPLIASQREIEKDFWKVQPKLFITVDMCPACIIYQILLFIHDNIFVSIFTQFFLVTFLNSQL